MDSYAVSAKYYDDAYAAEPDLVDLLFYLDLAKQFGGPVLEIACGTGRILLPIARTGIEIHGVDKSSSMLQVLSEQLEREPAEIRNRVTISKGEIPVEPGVSAGHHPASPDAAQAHLAGSGCGAGDRGGSSCAGRNPGL